MGVNIIKISIILNNLVYDSFIFTSDGNSSLLRRITVQPSSFFNFMLEVSALFLVRKYF